MDTFYLGYERAKRHDYEIIEFYDQSQYKQLSFSFLIEENQNIESALTLLKEVYRKTFDAFTYEVALSFAGEDRKYVDMVAEHLKLLGVDVFYDSFETVNLWGKDLYQYLSNIYKNEARYCVLFLSQYYKKKRWTNHELSNAQARAFKENKEYILPARFDDTEIPGVNETLGYVDLKDYTPREFANLIHKKIKSTT